MSFSINNNSSSSAINRGLNNASNNLAQTSKRLSSGSRINQASDDPAGLQIAQQLLAEESGYGVAIRNTSDAISVLSIGDSALETTSGITTRMTELSMQAANGTLSDEQRSALNNEYQALKAELDRTSQTAEFNGQSVFGSYSIQTGTDGSSNSQTTVAINNVSSGSLSLTSTDISTLAGAQSALTATQSATATIAQSRGEIGAAEQRLGVVIENNRTLQINTAEARSTIADADIATEAANYSAQKIAQSGNVALAAQSNLQTQNVLRLLT